MDILSGKKILLGVTGGIAAYKSTFLTRLLVKAGASVKVVMSPAAKDFVTPLSLSTLSKNPVFSSFVNDEDENDTWNNHVELGLWADLMIIAPVTANTMSKMVNGTIDNLLLAVYSSAKCPVYFAPAMDLDMYKHPSTIHNLNKLGAYGNIMIEAEVGELASGLSGKGRMAEPQHIVDFIHSHLMQQQPLRGKKCLITAGPTHESIDPVRFIGNHSTGKMGMAIAMEMANRGAQVTLVMGPSHIVGHHSLIHRIDVVSALEMYGKVHEHLQGQDYVICTAAVADYRPLQSRAQKIKKDSETLSIELIKNPDILASIGNLENKPFLVGFALETEKEVEHALGKAKRKNTDLLILNSMNDHGAGFGTDTNKITIIDRDGNLEVFSLKTKQQVAKDIIDEIIKRTS